MLVTTYIDSLVTVLGEAGPRTVLRRGGTDITGAGLLAMISRYARVLDGLGLGRGDLVALLAPSDEALTSARLVSGLLRTRSIVVNSAVSSFGSGFTERIPVS